jgi:hypothetical protein
MCSWCPTEYEISDDSINTFELQGVDKFTLFARIDVHYPLFHKHLDNSGNSQNTTRGLNVWTLEQMVKEAGYRWRDVNDTGMLLAINTKWDCDFDQADKCEPVIQFLRLDNPHSKLSQGYNFRTVEFLHDKYGARELTKRYGIRVILIIDGIGSQADIVAALTSIGAGIGLMSIAGLVADFISTRFLSQKVEINGATYNEVTIEDPKIDLALSSPCGRRKKKSASSSAAGSARTSRKNTNADIQQQDSLHTSLLGSAQRTS